MAATIRWFGPLIDLCKASSHIGDYVQLQFYIHKSTPIQISTQYKISKNGGEVVRLDILVGDEIRTYFPVTIWQKQMVSKVVAGNVYFTSKCQNYFGDAVEARTLHYSSLLCLIHSEDFLEPKVDGGVPSRDNSERQASKVAAWVQQARLVHRGSELHYYENLIKAHQLGGAVTEDPLRTITTDGVPEAAESKLESA